PRQGASRPLLGTTHLAEVALQVERAETHPAYARVLAEAGWAAAIRGDESGAKDLLQQSVDAQRAGARYAAAAFTYLLTVNSDHTDGDRLVLVAEGLRLAESSGDRTAEI